MRDEANDVLLSIEETLQIGRAVDVPVVISHHKCSMPENFRPLGRNPAARSTRRADQQRVDFDVYPYAAGSTVLMPDRLRPDVPVQITWSVPHPECRRTHAGRHREGMERQRHETPPNVCCRPARIFFQMDEQDVQRIMAHRLAMIGSDGLPHDAFPHPRLWGTFPRVLGHYARDLGLFSMEAAVHKMTGHTADVFGLVDRGVIRAGAYADLVLFDPATVRDASTFAEPTRPARRHSGNLDQRPVGLRARQGRNASTGRPPGDPQSPLTLRYTYSVVIPAKAGTQAISTVSSPMGSRPRFREGRLCAAITTLPPASRRRLRRGKHQRHRCLRRLQPERKALLDIKPHAFRIVIQVADREILPHSQLKIIAPHRQHDSTVQPGRPHQRSIDQPLHVLQHRVPRLRRTR